ncbi:hypothetical protein [uncultured Kordia sp.]|uniref:hypothetical protein n=1 Tax=uncultured Kordia sp. TaxID=507699 RepID=UPI00261A91A1|nr:hypothetical protein [uncultured Kordia sp.]
MKNLIIALTILCFISLSSCTEEDENCIEQKCGIYTNGKQLWRGPECGCYYINDNGNKSYVDREACSC